MSLATGVKIALVHLEPEPTNTYMIPVAMMSEMKIELALAIVLFLLVHSFV
jgi:hypothetical protein